MKYRITGLIWTILLSVLIFAGCTSTDTSQESQVHVSQNTNQATQASAIETQHENIQDDNQQVTETSQVQATTQENNDVRGELQVHFIDVGQGASQLIIGSSGKTFLIDAGNNSQEEEIVAYLRKNGIQKIDILVGTHPDADHIGGLDAVIDNFEIGKIYMPKVQSNTKTFEDVLLAIQRKGLKVSTAKAGVTLDWEPDAKVQMIAPVRDYEDDNDMSAVLKLTFGEISFLFTGDAESKSEHDMINSKVDLKSDVLLVAHHGSKSSTTEAFLDVVKPSFGVIQVGKNNYGHPAPEILERLNKRGVKVYRNDLHGDIVFITDGKNIKVSHTKDGKEEATAVSRTQEETQEKQGTQATQSKETTETVVYKNCTEVRQAGKAPLYRGDPGYSRKLDRDGDGVACE
ncbi:MBL fold metallo-hydrolase [Aneurinibacillus thermoaerophilus]|uniref:MBL fold metallo-hydrolase n=1 Tax=Aneurinibacillus thermoaerophilus TaxID=143495 RepID=UPI002E23C543|nr:excalibur calcium-binding domain-containing protein [Aneurinibacillus thermoaerophilus]